MRLFRLPHRSRTTTALVLACAAVLALTLGLVATSCGSTTSTSTTAGVTTSAGVATTAGGATSSSAAAGGGAQVEIKGFAFNPASITIKVGETVTWTNNDGATHTVTADNSGDFQSSGNLAQGDTYKVTFDKAGTFPYHCSIHPNMKATITVQ